MSSQPHFRPSLSPPKMRNHARTPSTPHQQPNIPFGAPTPVAFPNSKQALLEYDPIFKEVETEFGTEQAVANWKEGAMTSLKSMAKSAAKLALLKENHASKVHSLISSIDMELSDKVEEKKQVEKYLLSLNEDINSLRDGRNIVVEVTSSNTPLPNDVAMGGF